MQAYLSPSPKLRFYGRDGKPLSGGYLITYDYTTSRTCSTWADADMTTRNPVQISLDANGEPSQNGNPVYVFLEEGRRYKFRWFDSEMNQVGSIQPVQTASVNYGDNNVFNYYASVDGTEHEITVTSSIDPETGVQTFFIGLDDDFKERVSDIEDALDGKKNRQNELTFNGSATKTVKKIVQDENGEMDVEYEDIDFPEHAPNVNITSPNNTIEIQSSTEGGVKTFEIDVKGKALSLGWFTSRNMTYDSSLGVFKTDLFDKVNNGYENPQGNKITYNANTNKVYIAKGIWHIDEAIEIDWTGTTQNKFIYIAGLAFDLSYNHKETFSRGLVRQVNASTALEVTAQVSETPPQGLQVHATFCEIYALEQAHETIINGLESIVTDDTLTGHGTVNSPLGVVVDSALNSDSENPVQNKAIYAALGNYYTKSQTDTLLANNLNTSNKNFAADYDPDGTYDVGNYCIYHNELYVCTTDILVAEAWNDSHWQRTTMSDIVGDVESLLAAL